MQNTFLYKLFRFEFWPWYPMYLPLMPIYFAGVIYTRKLLYFTAVNPAIDMGGFFGEHKDEIQAILPQKYLVKSIVIRNGVLKSVESDMQRIGFGYPIIAKPIVGERGDGVKKLKNVMQLEDYAKDEANFIIQKYIDFKVELAVLFYRYPKSRQVFVSSLAEKRYLSVVGDGTSSVADLIQKNSRKRLYLPLIIDEFPEKLRIVPLLNQEFVIHTIGNHVKGTQFINVNNRINKNIVSAVKDIVESIEGVEYGRFDLKVPSYLDFEQGKNIKIFELNGVSSEPTHIYGLPNVVLAYRDLAKHWIILIKIAKQNIKKGVKTTPFLYFFTQVKNHFL